VWGWAGKRTGSRENTCDTIIQKNYVATGIFSPLPMTTDVLEKVNQVLWVILFANFVVRMLFFVGGKIILDVINRFMNPVITNIKLESLIVPIFI